ncbi:ABC transporter ATP-binding protein [Hyphomicrobium sp.]|uniref:ABC transporter ATP-binding protein n=1 Tax=Hyphomicrobium sp. TaxID=82 RepID=UPI002E3014A3|nr:ABC transporter ATP-binding protein [Hyphomicrobium sp.]HEX2843566.1 ABC transporter ATP-binding protein [Hyphomicrobium sp.]
MANWLFRKSDSASVTGVPRRARAGATFAAELTFDNVVKTYGERNALDHFSLVVAPGEVVCLLGPSGCGKTTLLRVTAGIERPTGGRILINDLEVAGSQRFMQPEDRGVGLMFQDFALFPHLTIVENVAFGLKALPREDARREALAILSRVGLERYADQYPHILSGGQQQRIALARAIVPRPAVMLMDEPFSGLDVQLRDAMQQETLALIRETRATSVIVTHHPEEAMRLGDRIVVMRAGKLVQTGRAEDLYQRPAELFVARLFSEINEIEARVDAGRIVTPFGVVAAPGLDNGASAILCIRERGVGLVSAPSNGGYGSATGLMGRVRDAKFLGDAVRYEVGVQGFDQPLNVRTAAGLQIGKGSEVRLHIDPEQVLIFPSNGVKTS